MSHPRRIMTAFLALNVPLAAVAAGPAVHGRPPEMQAAAEWLTALTSANSPQPATRPGSIAESSQPPFSFVYGGRPSADLLAAWHHAVEIPGGPGGGMHRRTATWTDPKTGLQVQAETVAYEGFPAVEWVLRLRNTGTADTPVLERILPLDARWRRGTLEPFAPVLHYAKGALCCLDDFGPVERRLAPGDAVHLQPGGGRSSSEFLPFFNLDRGGDGLVIAIGWTGEWAADFIRSGDRELQLRAGMAATHLVLHPGEEIRTPRLLALAWQGERVRGNNLLRRFLLAHHRPNPGGRPLTLPVLIGAWGGAAAGEHLRTIDRIIRYELPIELYWIDAEWFGAAPWYNHAGNWQLRRDLYPGGLRAISEPLHKADRRFLLWFEPQRICRDTPWAELKKHPNWLLELGNGNPAYQQRKLNWGIPHEDPRWVQWESRRSQIAEGDLLFNMGEPGARRFLTDWISQRIDEFGLDWYREDFNIAPAEFWQNADAPERQGMTEIRYVEGLYAMWDELLQRHPRLAIDNCASGGRRIDLETVGRATALWRTDWPVDAIHKQCHTFGLMSWVPLHMSGPAMAKAGNEYEIRSAMTAGLNVEVPREDNAESARQAKAAIQQYLEIRKYFYGDYYPLTPYSQASDTGLAYQLARPGQGEGLVVVFRRPGCRTDRLDLRLQGLERGRTYEVIDLDRGTTQALDGESLSCGGLTVQRSRAPDSALLRYRGR